MAENNQKCPLIGPSSGFAASEVNPVSPEAIVCPLIGPSSGFAAAALAEHCLSSSYRLFCEHCMI